MNPKNYSLSDAYNDGLAHGRTKSLDPIASTEAPLENGQGFGGDVVDSIQYGLAQAGGGLAETGYQLTGIEALADARNASNNWGKSQLEEMSPEGRDAMTAQIFEESKPDAYGETSLGLGEGATNWKTWALQLSSLAGQMVPQIALGGGFASLGAKVAGKVVMKTAAKKAMASGATKEASILAGKKAAEAAFASVRGGAGVVGYAAVGTAIAGGMIGNEVREEVMEMTNEQLDQSNEYRKLYYQLQDMQPELDVEGLRDLTKRTLADRTATTVQKDPMLITSNLLMEAVGGKFLDDIFRGVGSGSRSINAGKQFAVQGSTEAAQGGIEKYASNAAIISEGVDPHRDAFDGVKGAAANEGILGGALGGAMGAARKGEPLPQHEPLPIDNAEELSNTAESVQPESEQQQQPEMTLDEAVEQIKAERSEYRGIDDDIAIAQKQGFDEESVRLRAAKRNFEMAQDLMSEGDRDSAMRFRERGLKIYRDVMEPNSPDNHESSNLFPAEYVATGNLMPRENTGVAVANQKQGETIDAQRPADISQQLGSPAERLAHEDIIYAGRDTTEIDEAKAKTDSAFMARHEPKPVSELDAEVKQADPVIPMLGFDKDEPLPANDNTIYAPQDSAERDAAKAKTEAAFTTQQGKEPGAFNYDEVQQDKDQAVNRLTEIIADIKKTNVQDVNIKGERGRKGRVKIGDNYQPVTFKLVDMDANPALKPTISRSENQFRDRNRAASDTQIASIAAKLDFNELGESPRMTSGAPTLSREGRVIGGNGRMAAIRKAYAGKAADNYKAELKKRAKEFGINPTSIDKMKSPVLIRQFDNPVDIAKTAIESNNSGTMDMSALEQAAADNTLLPNVPNLEMDDAGNINWNNEGNRRSIRGFISALPQASQNSLLKSDGTISPAGIRRFENLLTYKAFGQNQVLDNLIENAKEESSQNIKNVLQSLAPHIAMVRQGMKRGDYHHIDITDHLVEAIELLESLRASSRSVSDYMAQLDMVSVTDPVTNAIAQELEENVRSPKALREQIKEYYDSIVAAGHPDQSDMFGTKSVSLTDLVGLNNDETNTLERDAGQDGLGSERAPTPQEAQPSNDSWRAATEPTASEPDASAEEELLTTYSEEDIATLEAKNKAASDAKAKAEQQSDQKAKADIEANDFKLSGSDRTADIAAAEGQNSLFDTAAKVDQAASETATSKNNDTPEPTEAQQEAGNYKKGHVTIQGLDIAIENERGSERKGTDPDGNEWAVKMAHHYGYIKKTEGADGDHVDVFIGKNPDSEKVFIVDQVNPDGTFDEHKVMLGFNNKVMAVTGYKSSYQKGWKVGPIKSMTMAEFKDWLKSGDTKSPSVTDISDSAKAVEESENTNETTQKDSAESTNDQEQKPAVTAIKDKNQPESKEPVKKDSEDNTEKLTEKGMSLQDKEAETFEDFGEVLAGAKKHTYSFNESISREIDIKVEPLSKSFPQPNYEKMAEDGISKDVLAFVAYLRANIPVKPKMNYKKERWAEKVTALRSAANKAISGEKSIKELAKGEGDSLSKHLVDNMYMSDVYALANEVLPSQIKDLGNYGLGKQFFQLYGKEKNVSKWEVTKLDEKGYRGSPAQVHFDTKEEALSFIKSAVTVSDKRNKPLTKFDVWTMRDDKERTVYVGKKVGTNKYIELATFKTSKEAREYIISHNAELTELLAKKKKVGNHRRVEQNERVGKDYRRGENVTTDLFTETFGFRGVQFGNWVENSRRQQDVNNAYDGLLDLAGVIGVPPKALSLNGELGLAFGSQGSGGKGAAAAHYNTATVVINLTKKNGAGSLAHEWFHALDGYFARAAGVDAGGITSSSTQRPKRVRKVIDGVQKFVEADPSEYGVRPEVYDAFKALMKSIETETNMVKRAAILDGRKTKNYWTADHELSARAFERYVIDKLKSDGYESDYLSSILSKDVWDAMELMLGNENQTYPYPTDTEAKVLNERYSAIFDSLKTKETDKGVALFKLQEEERAAGKIKNMREALQRTEDNPDSTNETNKPTTESAFSSVDDVKSWVAETEAFLGKKVNVVANKMDLPIAVKFRVGVANFGKDFDAIYDQETGETWINANQIMDKEHAIKTVLHETLGHGGVIDFLNSQESNGGKEVTDALEDIYRRAGRKLISRDIERYGFDYTDKNQRQTAVLEYIAHLAETGKKASWMHKVIGAIKNAMRKIFPNIAWTDLDTLLLLEKGRRHLRENGNDGQGGESLASLSKSEAEEFRTNLGRTLKSKRTRVDSIVVSKTPEILKQLGVPDNNITIERDIVRKATNGIKHDVSLETIEHLPELLADPVMVFDSKKAGSIVVVVDAKDESGRSVMTALQIDSLDKGIKVNRIGSVYGRESNEHYSKWIKEGLLRYIDKDKSSDLVRYEGLQLPRNGSLDQNSSTRVLTKEDLVNSSNDALMRLSDSIENDSTLTDKQKAFLDKIGPKSLKQTAVERLSEVMNRWRLKVRQGLVDRFAALLEMDKKILGGNVASEDNITSSSWVRARMSNGASGAVSAMMGAGRIYLDEGEGVIDVKQDTNGLVHALNKLGGAAEVEKFFGWIAANRAEKLAEDGRENLFTDEDIQAGKVLNQGTLQDGRSRNEVYDQVFTEFQQHRDDILAIAEKAGIITPENREMWANEFYVPFYRVMEDDDSVQGAKTMGGLSRQQAYKKLKGGSQNVNDLLQNTIMNFHHLVDASLKNLAAAQAMDNALELEVATPTNEATKSKQATFVLREGEKVWYDVHDDLVFQSLTALNSTGMNGAAMKTMRWFKRIFTNMTTSTPQFLVANLLRDSLSSMAVADLKFNPVGNVASGIKSFGLLDKTKYERARLLATGGAFSFGHIYGEDADSIRYYIDGEMRRADIVKDPAGLLKHGLKPVQAAWDKWQDVSNSFENANRMAAFKQAEEAGKGKLYAAHQSRDMMDFSGIGAWPAVRFLVDVVPFLNARLQGLDKLYRAGVKPTTKVVMNALGVGDVSASLSEKKAAARFMAVVGALSMATMALYLRNRDDEEYQKLEDWHKDSYWWFRVGDNAITIPKPFEVGAIATLTERLLEQAVDDKATGKLFAERLGHMLSSTFAFSPIPQMIQPTIDVYANKDSFTGRQIETMGQQRLSPSMRTTDRTTAAAELLGKGMEAALGADSSYTLSPIQIDYLIGGYFGQVGAWAVGHGDVLRNTLSNNERPARHWYENQPIRRFYKNLGDPHHDKQQSLFYEALRDSSRIYADLQQLRTDKDAEGASELKSENKELLSIRKQLSRTARRLSVLNARIKRIKANESIGSDEKRRQIDLLQVRKNALVERTKRLTDSLPR